MLQRGLKAKLLLWRTRTNDAGVITDQDGENESRLKRLCQTSSAFESIANHYRSSVIDIFNPFNVLLFHTWPRCFHRLPTS